MNRKKQINKYKIIIINLIFLKKILIIIQKLKMNKIRKIFIQVTLYQKIFKVKIYNKIIIWLQSNNNKTQKKMINNCKYKLIKILNQTKEYPQHFNPKEIDLIAKSNKI